MGRYFFIAVCAVVTLHFTGVTSTEVITPLLGFLAAHRTVILGGGLFGAFALVCAALIFNGVGLFAIFHLMAKAVYELVQFLLCATCLAALIFWFDLGGYFWLEGGGALVIVLYFLLYGAAFSLLAFDFNYPIKDTLFSYSVLPLVCIAVIWGGSLIWQVL